MSMTVWALTLLGLAVVLTFDFSMAWRNRNTKTTMPAATAWTMFYVSLAIIFGLSLGFWTNTKTQSAFFAGWLTEYSLSFDNLFVFILILAKLKVSKEREELVLLIGIVTSLVLRGVFIALGSAMISRWSWIFFIFGGFLIYTAFKLIRETEEEEWEEGKILKWMESKGASRFLIACLALAITDILFAFDSIPAIFGLTRDPYVIVTANIFALMGLRQLYFLIGGLMKKLIYLTEGLAILLIFIGIKLVLEAMHAQGWHTFGGIHLPEVSLQFSLGFIVLTLLSTASISLYKTRGRNDAQH
jgi:tellurite resistance protein TerC